MTQFVNLCPHPINLLEGSMPLLSRHPLFEGQGVTYRECANCGAYLSETPYEGEGGCMGQECFTYRDWYVGTIPSMGLARVDVATVRGTDSLYPSDVPTSRNVYGGVSGLPDPAPGVVYIVSLMVANACPNRVDLAIVNETVRNASGQIIGAQSLSFPNR